MATLRYAYAANRSIGLKGLQILLDSDWRPTILLVPDGPDADETARMCGLVCDVPILQGKKFRSPSGVRQLANLELDYLLSVHFPYIFPGDVLRVPRIGALNLHPSYLPFNRGWHTPTWAILEGTKYGATMHWITEATDAGDIVLQKELTIRPDDTAHQLYERVLALEEEILRESIPLLLEGCPPRRPQGVGGTYHRKADVERVQSLDLSQTMPVQEVVDRLRALTTNRRAEAAYFEVQGQRYRIRVEIEKADPVR